MCGIRQDCTKSLHVNLSFFLTHFGNNPSRRFHSIFSFRDKKGFNFVAQVAVGVAWINNCDFKAEGSFKPAWSPGTHSNYIFVVFTDFLRLLDEWRVDQWNWMGTFKVDRLIYKVTQPAGAWGGFCRRKPYIASLQTFGSFSNCIIIKKLWCRVENRSLG